LRGDVISPVRQATLPRQGLIGDGARDFSRRTVANGRATPGPARPYDRQLPAMPPSTRSSAPGSPWGSQSGAKGDGRARTKDIPARIRGVGGHPACREYTKKGSGQPGNLRACRGGPLLELAGLAEAGGEPPGAPAACQRTRASGTGSTLHPGRVGRGTVISWRWDGHALFGPMRLRRRATWDAALPGAAAAGFTLPRVIGG